MRLHVIKLPKNSGTSGTVRNHGIQFACGKYIAFLDSDDLYTKTALEELTTLAEKYQADVVHRNEFVFFEHDRFQGATTEELLSMKGSGFVRCNPTNSRLTEPTLAPDNFAERMKLWLNTELLWATMSMFCRRDFFIANQIIFPKMISSEDIVAILNCFCSAKKFVRVPNIVYIHRVRNESISHSHFSDDLDKFIHRQLNPLVTGFNELNKVMNRFEFFEEHPDYRYAVLDWFFNNCVNYAKRFPEFYSRIHPAAINPLVEKEFHPDNAAFSAYLFNSTIIQRIQIMQLYQELSKFQQQ